MLNFINVGVDVMHLLNESEDICFHAKIPTLHHVSTDFHARYPMDDARHRLQTVDGEVWPVL